MNVDQFPSLHGDSEKSFARIANAINDIADGVERGSIRNVVLKEAKFTISNAVWKAWGVVGEKYFNGGKIYEYPEDIKGLFLGLMVTNLHEVISASKKVNKSKAMGPVVDGVRQFLDELLPLSLAVAGLKDKVVMGRAPSAGPSKPENPDKIVRTCPCCFRAIAIAADGRMVHHGFERPGHGHQTASCPGVRFLSLEVSNEGLIWMIGQTESNLKYLEKKLSETDKTVGFMKRTSRGAVYEIKKDDPRFALEMRMHKANLMSEIDFTTRNLTTLKDRLANWKPLEQ